MLTFLKRIFQSSAKAPPRLVPESSFIVKVLPDEIVVHPPEAFQEHIPISEIQTIAIETNDTGPWGADVWFKIECIEPSKSSAFPQGATGEQEFIDWVFNLPGFDANQFLAAMQCTENRRFECWSAKA